VSVQVHINTVEMGAGSLEGKATIGLSFAVGGPSTQMMSFMVVTLDGIESYRMDMLWGSGVYFE